MEALLHCKTNSKNMFALAEAGWEVKLQMNRKTDESHEFLSGDRVAEFVELYTRYYPRLQFYLMAMLPTPNDAADVLQESSVVLWEKFGTYKPGTNFYAWACEIARLQTLKYRARMGRRAQLLDDAVLEKLSEEAVRNQTDPTASLEALAYCLDQLSDRNRSLIRRRYQPQVRVQDLAVEYDRSANSLSQLLGRIRRMLLECVEKRLAEE